MVEGELQSAVNEELLYLLAHHLVYYPPVVLVEGDRHVVWSRAFVVSHREEGVSDLS